MTGRVYIAGTSVFLDDWPVNVTHPLVTIYHAHQQFPDTSRYTIKAPGFVRVLPLIPMPDRTDIRWNVTR